MRYSEVDAQYKIDIISFLRNYLGITGSSLKQNKITHDDLKVLFPDLVRLPYNLAYKNPELVYSGEYLIVYDCHYQMVVYKNPLVLEEVLPQEESNYDDNRKSIPLPDLSILSKDELLKLRRQVRLLGDHKKANIITSFIRKVKKKEPKRYREERDKLRYLDRIEEEENYEKIKRR